MTKGKGKQICLPVLFLLLFLAGTFLQVQTAFAALTANVADNSTVQLDWANTGSSPYKLNRDGTQIYSGSGTQYTDSELRYSTGYNYTLDYQNYEKTGGGYYSTRSYWGIVTAAYSYTSQEWELVSAGHFTTTETSVGWCSGTVGSTLYEHAPPCQYSTNSTTKTVYDTTWVPDQYGWVNVTYYVADEYGWVDESYWVSEQYGYVTRTASITSGLVLGTSPSVAIISPANGQWLAESIVPTISVSDKDGDTLSITYSIDEETTVRETKTISNTAAAQEVAFSRLSLAAFSEGKHTLKVNVADNHYSPVVKTIEFYADKSGPILGNIQSGATDSSITVAGSATDSGVGLTEKPYRYTIGSNSSAWTADSSYTFNSLSPDKAYQITVEARDKLERISAKQQVVYTKAQTPAVSVTQSAESTLGIKINDDNPSATLYQIKVDNQYIDAAGKITASPVSINLINKQLTVSGLLAGTTYSIQALAINQEGTATNWSQIATGMTHSKPPTSITTSRTQNSITLNWLQVVGGAGYDVEADGIVAANGTTLNYKHTGLSPDTRHTYRVRTNNAGGIGKWSTELQVFTLPNPPATPTSIVTAFEQNYVTLSWDSSARAESYEVEADGKVMEAGSGTTYTHSGLQADSPHAYRVRAINIGGISAWSEPITVTTWPDPPPTPEKVAAQPLIHTVTMTWDAADRATGYEIEADGFIIDAGNQTRYVAEGLEPLTGHTYRLRAKNIGGKSAWSAPISITTHPEIPTTPSNLMATSEESSITVTWYKVPHTESYDVEIDGVTLVSLTDNLFVHPSLSPDSRHTYRVRANNISGSSKWSSPITMATLPSSENSALSLTNVAVIVTSTFVTFSWDTVALNAQYDVEVDGVLMDNGSNTIFNHTGLKANEFHTYKIRVKDRESTGDWVAILALSTLPNPPDAPLGIQAFPAINSIELRWEKVNGATGYDIEIDGKAITVGEEAAYLHQDLALGTAHTYRIRAKNVTGVTAWSPFIVQSTSSPSYLINGIRGTEFDLSLFVYNVQDFSELTYVVTYNPNEIEVVDLHQFTPQADVNGGKIPGTSLEAQYTPGKITFKVTRNVVPGTSWSGEMTTIVFKTKVTGQSKIDVVVK